MSQENEEVVRSAFAEFGRNSHLVGRGKSSDVPTEWRHGQVWTMRDGKAVSIRAYADPLDALEAVGLSE